MKKEEADRLLSEINGDVRSKHCATARPAEMAHFSCLVHPCPLALSVLRLLRRSLLQLALQLQQEQL